MGRAMLIICAGVLVAMGFVTISTSNTGKMLVQQNVNYAEYTMAKNAAHTAIQIAMQEINQDEDWPNQHPEGSPWITTVQGLEVRLHTQYEENDYWETEEHDLLWFYSRAQLGEEFGNRYVEVRSHYEKRPFFDLVPEFNGALQFPTDIGEFNVDGNAYGINGTPPAEHNCPEVKPPIVVNSDSTKEKIEDGIAEHNQLDGDIDVDPSLNYEPTDELIERLWNSSNRTIVNSDYGGTLGSASNPGVFFIEGDVRLTGRQSEGYGIMVIRNDAFMEYQDDDGNTLVIRGNFEFNGLVVFENAQIFDARGTPTINGSVLIGNTGDYEDNPIDIDLGGNIEINYDCKGEMYAKQAAANAVQQNKYTRLVSSENIRFASGL